MGMTVDSFNLPCSPITDTGVPVGDWLPAWEIIKGPPSNHPLRGGLYDLRYILDTARSARLSLSRGSGDAALPGLAWWREITNDLYSRFWNVWNSASADLWPRSDDDAPSLAGAPDELCAA